MGIGIGISRDNYQGTEQNSRNPDPSRWEIRLSERIGRFLIIRIYYPNCTNYEGEKILVYENVLLDELKSQGKIDPHFSDNKQYLSPIARFEPTAYGLSLARKFAKAAND